MRVSNLLAALSLTALAGCGPIFDLPEVGAQVTGPATLAAGSEAQYQATISSVSGSSGPTTPSPGWAIKWKTSEPSIATVTATGMVTAVAAGRVTITATPFRGTETGFSGTISVVIQ